MPLLAHTSNQRLLDAHSQVWLSLLWGHCSFPLGPGGHKIWFVLSKILISPVPWKFCNQIPLAFKVKFHGGSQFLSQIPRLGNLLWALELLQQCEHFFGIIILQCVGCLFGGFMVGLTPRLPGLLQPELLSPQQATADPCLCRRHLSTQTQAWLKLLWGTLDHGA